MRKKRKSDSGGFNIWRSYSDMMAGVLLLFVLIMCVTLFQAQKNYDDSIRERTERVVMEQEYSAELSDREKQLEELAAKLAAQQTTLEDQEKTLAAQRSTLDDQEKTLSAQQSKLDEQSATLAEQQSKLDEQSATLIEQQSKLEEQSATLAQQQSKLEEQSLTMAAQQTALDEKTELLAMQQQKIDNIIGVKADVVSALKSEFAQNDLHVNIDEESGAMTLESNVIFDYDEAELKEEGQDILAEVLPIYCSVLLQDEYLPYLAEITIDGYTDSEGDYYYNLELSQARAKAVADYLLMLMPDFLDSEEIGVLMEHLTVNAHSMSNFVYDSDGNIDDDASRRVEVKFRLKDEEMIQELNEILSQSAE